MCAFKWNFVEWTNFFSTILCSNERKRGPCYREKMKLNKKVANFLFPSNIFFFFLLVSCLVRSMAHIPFSHYPFNLRFNEWKFRKIGFQLDYTMWHIYKFFFSTEWKIELTSMPSPMHTTITAGSSSFLQIHWIESSTCWRILYKAKGLSRLFS